MPARGSHTDSPAERSPNYPKLNGSAERRGEIQMTEDRMSGSLEGSTLGSSSRDGDKGPRGQRRTPSSGGFLLDSSFMPRPKSLRISHHRPRRSEPDRREKRVSQEPDINVPKKRSRFPWSRHKHPAGSSSLSAIPSGSADTRGLTPEASDGPQLENNNEPTAPGNADTDQTGAGFDRDSIQIVNLALNLSESRKRSSLGWAPSTRLPGSKTLAYGERHVPAAMGNQLPQARRPLSQMFPNDMPRLLDSQSVGEEQSPVLNLLSEPDPNSFPVNVSESTLARADNARRHFELFSEYLRLLPFLPPLKSDVANPSTGSTSVTNNGALPCRSYNPLQSIRNRKLRFREKCPIDTEAEGWNDVEKVRQWVNDIEEQSSDQSHSPTACIKLPPFHNREGLDTANDPELLSVSPQSSMRQTSRTTSGKTPRPRLDWIISPAELLSDAAWVEHGQNKSKVVDKNGDHIYPDPTELDPRNSSLDIPSSQRRRRFRDRSMDRQAFHTPLAQPRSSMSHEFKTMGRGRQRHRLSSPSSAMRSSSVSSKGDVLKQRKGRVRSRASSTLSSMSGGYPRSSSNTRFDAEKSPGRHAPGRLSSHMFGTNRFGEGRGDHNDLPVDTRSSPYQSKEITGRWKSHQAKGSLSSGGSVDDPYSPRMSMEGVETSPANSPSRAGYFPSITVNLSPPSSRSPSPSKRPFSRMMVPRHEQNKSRHRKEVRDHTDESLHSEALHKYDSPGKLEPSPLPDRVSSAYEGQSSSDVHEVGSAKSQRSPQQESKLRGLFKGPGKIAGIVGSEVSRVGDRIMKKDNAGHPHKSSDSVSSIDSEMDEAEETKSDKKSAQKAFFGRLPAFSEDRPRLPRRSSERVPTKGSFAPPIQQDVEDNQGRTSQLAIPHELGQPSRSYEATSMQKDAGSPLASQRGRFDPHVSADIPDQGITFRPPSYKKGGQIRDPSVPFGLTQPPVTGLAQARASPGPSRERGQRMSLASRTWSISDRSLSVFADSGLPEKREIERTRALLLSSGIKAREITRRAETVRDPPPEFLETSVGPNEPVPRVARVYEYDIAIQNLLQAYERSESALQQSMDRFPEATSSPLRSQLINLENLVNQTLSPRVRAVGDDAEDMSVQLHTTGTLTVKQLSDALDRGLRKRRRRLRWFRRAGFVVLEWALVGVLWWVWLIVMVFKLFRGVLRGAVSGIKWVLWL